MSRQGRNPSNKLFNIPEGTPFHTEVSRPNYKAAQAWLG